jgi:hypothetical protein
VTWHGTGSRALQGPRCAATTSVHSSGRTALGLGAHGSAEGVVATEEVCRAGGAAGEGEESVQAANRPSRAQLARSAGIIDLDRIVSPASQREMHLQFMQMHLPSG